MTTIKYKIQFYSEWHCGSGMGSGADLDLLVIKDAEGLPFVPGKTIKGLLKEMLYYVVDNTVVDRLMGAEGHQVSELYFTNAKLGKFEKDQIIEASAQAKLYCSVASTAIDKETGIAVDNSLRKIETTIPLSLEGQIRDVASDDVASITIALAMIKRLGQSRNRGLGRCDFIIEK